MAFQPLGGWRQVSVTERRTAVDYAQFLKDLVDIHFPNAIVISVVQDNLNTHPARRCMKRLRRRKRGGYRSALGDVAIIAEDLGDFTPESRAGLDALMARFDFPGMRILQFAFNCREGDRFFPHNYPCACIVYTGTHDNDTPVGWFTGSSTDAERRDALRYLCGGADDIAWAFIRTAWMSVADTVLTTVQDLLGLGSEVRMNLPGTQGSHNWTWRMPVMLSTGASPGVYAI